MMRFRELKQAIIDDVLVPAEAGRFKTVGNHRERISAEEINTMRRVTVYYSEGDFPKSHGQAYGDVTHEIAFRIEMIVSADASVDIATLNDENKSEAQKATALDNMLEAGAKADDSLDELIDIVYQILMDNRNDQLGLTPPVDHPNLRVVANRWIDQIRKDPPLQEGALFTITASMRLSCRIEESITGEALGALGNKTFDNTIALDGDDIAKQGVEVIAP